MYNHASFSTHHPQSTDNANSTIYHLSFPPQIPSTPSVIQGQPCVEATFTCVQEKTNTARFVLHTYLPTYRLHYVSSYQLSV